MLGNLIGGFVVIIVGVNLVPTVADSVYAAQHGNCTGANCVSGNSSTNITGATSTILGLTTLFFALGIASAGISVAAQGLRAAGLLGI